MFLVPLGLEVPESSVGISSGCDPLEGISLWAISSIWMNCEMVLLDVWLISLRSWSWQRYVLTSEDSELVITQLWTEVPCSPWMDHHLQLWTRYLLNGIDSLLWVIRLLRLWSIWCSHSWGTWFSMCCIAYYGVWCLFCCMGPSDCPVSSVVGLMGRAVLVEGGWCWRGRCRDILCDNEVLCKC